MSKKNWASTRAKALCAAALLLASAACTGGGTPSSVPPTQALIPAAPTETATPVTPTATTPVLLAPGDVATHTPASTPPAAQALAQAVIDDLAALLNVSPDSVQLVSLDSAQWTTANLGCSLTPMQIGGQTLTVDGYRIELQANGTRYEYHTDAGTRYLRCEREGTPAAATLAPDALLAVDPVAAELVALAQRLLAEELNLPVRRIRIVTVQPVVWQDSSLGCPQRGQTYTMMPITGYRLVFAIGDDEVIFHTDAQRLNRCDRADEVLP